MNNKKLFPKKLVQISVLPILSICMSGCLSATQNDPAQGSMSERQLAPAKLIASIIDQALQAQGYGQEQGSGAPSQMDSLQAGCKAAGGRFNEAELECFCPQGKIFTTAKNTPQCLENSASLFFFGSYGNFQSGDPLYSIDPSFSNRLTLDWGPHPTGKDATASEESEFKKALDQSEKSAFQQHSSQSLPYRLAFLGSADLEYDLGASHLTAAELKYRDDQFSWYLKVSGRPESRFYFFFATALGLPYSSDLSLNVGQHYMALYEANPHFLKAALGLGELDLTPEEATEFHQLKLSAIPKSSLNDELKSALEVAYQSFQSAITAGVESKPDQVTSPFKTGCASYCTASWNLNLSSDQFTASFKKVYQLGMPSSRLLVLQSNGVERKVVAVMSLNPALTVSTINLVHENGSQIKLDSYDRMGDYLWSEQTSQDLSLVSSGILGQ